MTIDIKNLPKNSTPADLNQEDEQSRVSYPTVVRQARENMLKYKDCVVLTRVGGFYELYFEQADELGPLLGIKVASKKTSAGAVPMAGFPFFQLERFLKILIQDLGKHVAIAEEIANDPSKKIKSGGLLFDRQVKRVVTPGTLIDEHFITPHEHNYLLAIFVGKGDHVASTERQPAIFNSSESPTTKIGVAWLDLSSGDFFTKSVENSEQLASAIARIGPREMILDITNEYMMNDPQFAFLTAEGAYNITFQEADHSPSASSADLKNIFGEIDERASIPDQFSTEEISSSKMLLDYVQTQLPGLSLRVLQTPSRQQDTEYMKIDRNTLRGLEVTQTLRDGAYKGSLLHAVRRTSTESGTRLLARRLSESCSRACGSMDSRLKRIGSLAFHVSRRHQRTSRPRPRISQQGAAQ